MPRIITAAIRLPTGYAGYLWALPSINTLGATKNDLSLDQHSKLLTFP